MSVHLENCRICKFVVPIEDNILQIYDDSCIQFLSDIKEISGVNFFGVFKQPWYICVQCYNDFFTAQEFRKKCIQAIANLQANQISQENSLSENIVENVNGNKTQPWNSSNDIFQANNHTKENENETTPSEASTENNKEDEMLEPEKELKILSVCEFCGNVFQTKRTFKEHLQRHTNNKRFECELCLRKFFTNAELKCHMRKHTGEKPYKCKFCDRKFSDYGSNKKHERTHTNERPFSCNFCDKSFTNAFILKNHILIHTGKRDYECKVCKKAFMYPGHLTSHLKSILHLRNCKIHEENEMNE